MSEMLAVPPENALATCTCDHIPHPNRRWILNSVSFSELSTQLIEIWASLLPIETILAAALEGVAMLAATTTLAILESAEQPRVLQA